MAFVIIIVVIAAIAYFVMSRDAKEVRERGAGRTKAQKDALRYFLNDGCLKKRMSDDAYDKMVQEIAANITSREKALEKVGLDESETQEIEPIHLENYLFPEKGQYFARKGKRDGIWRSSMYQITWLFFSETQVHVYQYTFHTDEDGKKESTEEYFYKDITNFSTSSDLVEVPTTFNAKTGKYNLENVNTTRFKLIVPGDSFYCAMEQNDYTEKAVKAMKNKLREKKTA